MTCTIMERIGGQAKDECFHTKTVICYISLLSYKHLQASRFICLNTRTEMIRLVLERYYLDLNSWLVWVPSVVGSRDDESFLSAAQVKSVRRTHIETSHEYVLVLRVPHLSSLSKRHQMISISAGSPPQPCLGRELLFAQVYSPASD